VQAEKEGGFIEAMFMEHVMGEGDPVFRIQPGFYLKARELTAQYGSLLIVDSVQAGFRATGYLSIIDYPGFRQLPAPDIEVFSKAINGGQYPLSVIGLSKKVREFFKIGLYGNTMTANPRALDVGSMMLNSMTDELRQNIESKGIEAVDKFKALQQRYPEIIKQVQGTGLLFSVSVDATKAEITGQDGLERQLRCNGIGVIHGGDNALRFTPHFALSSNEIDLMVREVERVISPLALSSFKSERRILEEELN
jgi:acetylornithine/succinyldiaminopimelate/putrescine aminotransferase